MRKAVIAVLLLYTGTLLTNGFALRVTEEPKRKLIVNSHVKYRKIFDDFVASLKAFKFTNWGDVVVIQGGSPVENGPRVGTGGMTFVKTTANNFDLHGFAMLYRYRHHHLLQADVYFYVLDSSRAGPCFPRVFNQITPRPSEVITTENQTSNICVFGRKVIDSYRNNFDKPLSKKDGMRLEAYGEATNGVHPIGHFGKPWTKLPHRNFMGDSDWYRTGHPRTIVWYREWDLYKAIFWGKQGDITGGISNISKSRKPLWPLYGEFWGKHCRRTPIY